ncbi:hypothetical protein ATL31_2021 [Phycicoccus duodecadis]|uniref:FkbM family methyltransferase n=1 Tax=Phycicoccus duodecadis TaxID=173053 RepID=A0A2N3YJZ6_9MICO|nr:hypothetical protein ATL31_2021 [Phycicoccus duodecadis]
MRRQADRLREAVRQATARDRTDEVLFAMGQLQCSLQEVRRPTTLNDAEFKVFSQYGEDGAIQFLLRHVAPCDPSFIEIGVQSYRESNTRFLASNNNWRGLAIDGSSDHLAFIRGTELGWRADVLPVRTFVTKENINDVIESHGYTGDVGLVSIDVDGMDYWLLEALEVVRPTILIVEFNSIFGPSAAVTVPYTPTFVCGEAHWSHQYFGASLSALTALADRKGYALVGATKHAVNAFFVLRESLGDLNEVPPASAWRPSRFLSSRNQQGDLSYVRDHVDRLRLIADLPLSVLPSGQEREIRDIFDL